MRKVTTIVLATNNRHKLEEVQSLVRGLGNVIISAASEFLSNADKLSLVEKFSTYEENALAKARACNHACHYPSLADDSGIEVAALSDAPGVHSHRYAIPKVGQTQDLANNLKLLEALKGSSNRSARFVCHLALVMEGISIHASGACEGQITNDIRSDGGFGYDPIFIPAGYDKTFAELGPEVKNKISHRALALEQLFQKLHEAGLLLVKP